MANLQNTNIDDTGSLNLPSGTTSQRPSNPQAGMVRFNTSLNRTEFYDGSNWQFIGDTNLEATGGKIVDTEIAGIPYRTHLFTSTGSSSFTVTRGGEIEYLIVAGGGGGGNNNAGGGGAGGLIQGITSLSTGTYTITVGAGGPAGSTGSDGGNSSAFGLTAIGGGGGTRYNEGQPGRDGGSGGGGGGQSSTTVSGGSALQPGSSSGGFGHDGGIGGNLSINGECAGGGGGGAGGPGEDGFSHSSSDERIQGPRGGMGISTNITGEFRFFAAGGAGGPGGIGGNGIGGLGGGGDSCPPYDTDDNNGIGFAHPARKNTGSGGGGGDNTPGGDGADGIIVIRYRKNQNNSVAADETKISNLPATSGIWTVSKKQRFSPAHTPKVLIHAESEGLNNTNGYRRTAVFIEGNQVFSGNTGRSLRITHLRETAFGYEYVESRTYDAYGQSGEAQDALNFLEENFQTGDVMIMTTYDHLRNHSRFHEELQRHFESRAGIDFTIDSERASHLLVAIKNQKRLFENYRPAGDPGFTSSIWLD